MDYENNDIDIMEQLDDSFEDEFFGSEIKDEEDLYNEDEENPKSGRRKKNEDGGFSRLGIHNELPLDASPSPEKLTLIYQYVHSGDPELRQEGTLQMCGIMHRTFCTSSQRITALIPRSTCRICLQKDML